MGSLGWRDLRARTGLGASGVQGGQDILCLMKNASMEVGCGLGLRSTGSYNVLMGKGMDGWVLGFLPIAKNGNKAED